jgi:hypothetical protein
MSKIKTRAAAFATIILSLGFAATGVAPALAQVERTQMSPRATVHRYVAYQSGYADRMPASHPVAAGNSGPNSQFVTGRGIDGASCDLPSSGCPDDQRITN